MIDPWIDDENDEKKVLNVQTKEQLKRIEERKLIIESDIALTMSLFHDDKNIKKELENKNIKKEISKESKKTIIKRENK